MPIGRQKQTKSNRSGSVRSSKTLPPIDKNISLSKYGYSVKSSKSRRHSSLKRASKQHSSLTVLRRLNLIRNYSKSGSKENYKRLSDDVEYMKKQKRLK